MMKYFQSAPSEVVATTFSFQHSSLTTSPNGHHIYHSPKADGWTLQFQFGDADLLNKMLRNRHVWGIILTKNGNGYCLKKNCIAMKLANFCSHWKLQKRRQRTYRQIKMVVHRVHTRHTRNQPSASHSKEQSQLSPMRRITSHSRMLFPTRKTTLLPFVTRRPSDSQNQAWDALTL